jgi:ribonuclease T2
MMRLLHGPFLLALAALLPVPALAQAYQCRIPERIEPLRAPQIKGPVRKVAIGSYILAASWSPEYCRKDTTSMQCSGRNGRFGFVLHGLWPEARNGPPPQWCALTPRPSAELVRQQLCMTPVPWMIEHEWAKHGSCMAKRPETYFKVSAILWRSVNWPDADRLSRREGLTAGDLRDALLAINPDWQRDQVGIETGRRGWLKGVRLCYSRRFRPQRCARDDYGPPDRAPLKIWRGM